MAKNCNNNIINIYSNNSNTYEQFKTKEKLYTYCWQCGVTLSPPSPTPFCCWEHQQEYYAEQRKEDTACFREWSGRS